MGCLPFFVRPPWVNGRRLVVTSFLCPRLYKIMPTKKRNRPESDGSAKTEYQKNKRRVLAEQEYCAICGRLVDKSLKFPHPLSASVDHITPIALGGHPSAYENLQLTHLICNQSKGAKTVIERNKPQAQAAEVADNRQLPWSRDWLKYGAG